MLLSYGHDMACPYGHGLPRPCHRMSSLNLHYSVVLDADVRVNVSAFSPTLAGILGVPLADARRLVRRGRGIFLENVGADAAERVAAALRSTGVAAAAVPAADLPPYPRRAVRVQQMAFAADGLRWRRNRDEPERVLPWGDVKFLSAGLIATPAWRDFFASRKFSLLPAFHKVDDPAARQELRTKIAAKAMEGGLDDHPEDVPERLRETDEYQSLVREKTEGWLDLLVAGRAEVLRVNRAEFSFDCLGMDTTPSGLENFRRLAGELRRRLPAVPAAAMTGRLAAGEEVHRILFDDADAFVRYNRWVMRCAGVRPETAAAAPGRTCGTCGAEIPAGRTACVACKLQGRVFRYRSKIVALLVVLALLLGLFGWGLRGMQESEREGRAVQILLAHRIPAEAGGETTIGDAMVKLVESQAGRIGTAPWRGVRQDGGSYRVYFNIFRSRAPGDAGGPMLQVQDYGWLVNLDTGAVSPVTAFAKGLMGEKAVAIARVRALKARPGPGAAVLPEQLSAWTANDEIRRLAAAAGREPEWRAEPTDAGDGSIRVRLRVDAGEEAVWLYTPSAMSADPENDRAREILGR